MTTNPQRPFTAASYNQYLAENKLMGSHCLNCQASFLPPRAICPHCYSDQLTWLEFSGKGRLAAFTAIYIAPTAMIAAGYGRDKPYLAGIVELEEGVKISAQINGLPADRPEQVKIGALLQVEFIERGENEQKKTFLAFRPE